MGWLEDVIAALRSDPMAGPQPYRDPIPTAKVESSPLGPVADMSAQDRLLANPAFGFPANPRSPSFDISKMANPSEWSPFGEPPAMPSPVPQMEAQAPIPGLNSPMGGGGAPFSIAGAPSPSMVQAKAMAAPPQMPQAPQAPPLAAAAQPVMAQGGEPPGAPTEASAQSRPAPPGAPPAAAPMGMVPQEPQKPFLDRLAALGPGLTALGAGLSGQGWGASQELARNQQALQLQQQQGNATARLLASKGASMPEIQAAISGGPDTLKALLGQYMTKDKFTVTQTGEDKYGQKIFKLFNAADGTLKEIPAGSAAEAKTIAQSQELEGITGAARLDALKATDPAYARKVQSAVNGDISLPTGRAATSPAGRKFIEDVLGVDGTVSEADFKIRQQVRKNYTSGKDFQVTKSINTVVDHGAQLEKAIEKLGNNNYLSAITNPVRDAFLSQTDPEYIKAKQAFKTNAENFAREMDFALSGGRPTVSGAAHQREAFDALAAQVGQKEALRKSIELLEARLREHQRGYEEALPPGTRDAPVPHLERKTEDFIKRILGSDAPVAPKPKSGTVDIGGKKIPWSVN